MLVKLTTGFGPPPPPRPAPNGNGFLKHRDFPSSPKIVGDELAISRVVSQSLNDLSGKISEIKDLQMESQNEFLALISRLTSNLQTENKKSLDHFITLFDDQTDHKEERHLRCRIEILETEKRTLDSHSASLRDRVSELGRSIETRDDELTRERHLNDKLREALEQASQEVKRLNEEREELKEVNVTLIKKVEDLTREMAEAQPLRENINLELMKIENEKSSLAYQAAVLAGEKQKFYGNMDYNP